MDNNEEMITPELISSNAIKQAENNVVNTNNNIENNLNTPQTNLGVASAPNNVQNETVQEPKRYTDIVVDKPKFDPVSKEASDEIEAKVENNSNNTSNAYVLNHANSSTNNYSEDESSYTKPVRMKDYMASAAFNNGAEKTNENTKTKNVKMGPLSIPISAYIFFLGAIVHYFLIAPFIGKYLLEHSLYEALNVVARYLGGNNSQIHNLLLYLFTFLFIAYSIISFLLLVYGIINIIKKGENLFKFASHIKKIIGLTILLSIIVMVVLMVSDFDILTPLLRVVTLNGYQYKIIGFAIGL